MSAATETVQAEWAARAVVLADLRRLADWQRRTGRTDHEGADIAVSQAARTVARRSDLARKRAPRTTTYPRWNRLTTATY